MWGVGSALGWGVGSALGWGVGSALGWGVCSDLGGGVGSALGRGAQTSQFSAFCEALGCGGRYYLASFSWTWPSCHPVGTRFLHHFMMGPPLVHGGLRL